MPEALWICPLCRTQLAKKGGSYLCANGHCYDISSAGYVNLLLANRKHSRNPGDAKEMLEARRNFLDAGYYAPLPEKIAELIREYIAGSEKRPCIILDAGCGEGYFIEALSRDGTVNKNTVMYGMDISRYGIRSASRRTPGACFAVGNTFDMPVPDRSVDILINIFSPFNEAEFSRVLEDDGMIISVNPGSRHLEGLKKILYDDPHPHDEETVTMEKLLEIHSEKLEYIIEINSRDDISCLVKMTPYYYKTGQDRITHVLEHVSGLTTAVDFVIHLYKKQKET